MTKAMEIKCPQCGYPRYATYHSQDGIVLACKACKHQFTERRVSPYKATKLKPEQIAILRGTLTADPEITTSALARTIGVAWMTAKGWRKRLEKEEKTG